MSVITIDDLQKKYPFIFYNIDAYKNWVSDVINIMITVRINCLPATDMHPDSINEIIYCKTVDKLAKSMKEFLDRSIENLDNLITNEAVEPDNYQWILQNARLITSILDYQQVAKDLISNVRYNLLIGYEFNKE